MGTKKQFNPDNCDTCIRGVYRLDYRTQVIISGQYAHKWSINIIKTVFNREIVTTYTYKNGNEARKDLTRILKKNKL